MQMSGGHLQPPVQTLVATFIFAHSRAKMQIESCYPYQKAGRANALPAFIFMTQGADIQQAVPGGNECLGRSPDYPLLAIANLQKLDF